MKKANEEVTITLAPGEVLTDLFDHGGDATDDDDADSVSEIRIKNK